MGLGRPPGTSPEGCPQCSSGCVCVGGSDSPHRAGTQWVGCGHPGGLGPSGLPEPALGLPPLPVPMHPGWGVLSLPGSQGDQDGWVGRDWQRHWNLFLRGEGCAQACPLSTALWALLCGEGPAGWSRLSAVDEVKGEAVSWVQSSQPPALPEFNPCLVHGFKM